MIGTKLATDVHSNEETTDLLYSLQGELSNRNGGIIYGGIQTIRCDQGRMYKQIENNLKGDYLTDAVYRDNGTWGEGKSAYHRCG